MTELGRSFNEDGVDTVFDRLLAMSWPYIALAALNTNGAIRHPCRHDRISFSCVTGFPALAGNKSGVTSQNNGNGGGVGGRGLMAMASSVA